MYEQQLKKIRSSSKFAVQNSTALDIKLEKTKAIPSRKDCMPGGNDRKCCKGLGCMRNYDPILRKKAWKRMGP